MIQQARTRAIEALDAQRAFTRRDAADVLRMSGADALDLLHRIAASEVRPFDDDQTRRLLFTDDKGRVVDAPLAWRRGDALVLLAGPSRGPALQAWIEKWIIMEDARVQLDPDHVVLDLAGTASLEYAARLVANATRNDQHDTSTLLDLGHPVGAIHGHLVADPASAAHIAEALRSTLEPIDDLDLAAWCAREGLARPGPGLAAGCHPLELGWKHWVSFTKGCYIGQEVVARLDTYDKVKRAVAPIRCESLPAIAAAVRFEGKKVGVVLEAATIERQVHAVAVVDRQVEAGAALELENAGAGTLTRIPAL